MSIAYILLAILLIGILVIIHEGGHFFAARMTGIPVQEFAVGFGPKLCQWQSKKSGTRYSIRLLPLGGYCAFYAEDPENGLKADDPRLYYNAAVWKRIVSVLMGPMMNFVLAFVVMVIFYVGIGTYVVEPYITAVTPEGPAAMAGIQENDHFLTINGVDVSEVTANDLVDIIHAYDGVAPLSVMLNHADGTMETVALTPVMDETDGVYRVGVSIGHRYRTEKQANGELAYVSRPTAFGTALEYSWNSCVYAGTMVLTTLRDLVTRGEGIENTTGIVGTVAIISQQVQSGGLESFLNLLVIISINLGIINLLPIPGLDGSRFLFLLLEAIRRKPVPPEKESAVHMAGMLLLMVLAVVLIFKDIWMLVK